MPWIIPLIAIGTSIAGAASQPNYGKMAADAEEKKQKNIDEGMKGINETFAGYTPKFYKQREDAYLKYALPQESSQFRDAQKGLTFSLANRGVRNSSIANTNWSTLNRAHAGAQQQVADQAVNTANDLKSKVESGKQNVIDSLYQSADPLQAKAKAISIASQFQNPDPFAPLSNMFGNLTNQWTTNSLLSSYQKGQNFAGGGSSSGSILPLAPLGPTYSLGK